MAEAAIKFIYKPIKQTTVGMIQKLAVAYDGIWERPTDTSKYTYTKIKKYGGVSQKMTDIYDRATLSEQGPTDSKAVDSKDKNNQADRDEDLDRPDNYRGREKMVGGPDSLRPQTPIEEVERRRAEALKNPKNNAHLAGNWGIPQQKQEEKRLFGETSQGMHPPSLAPMNGSDPFFVPPGFKPNNGQNLPPQASPVFNSDYGYPQNQGLQIGSMNGMYGNYTPPPPLDHNSIHQHYSMMNQGQVQYPMQGNMMNYGTWDQGPQQINYQMGGGYQPMMYSGHHLGGAYPSNYNMGQQYNSNFYPAFHNQSQPPPGFGYNGPPRKIRTYKPLKASNINGTSLFKSNSHTHHDSGRRQTGQVTRTYRPMRHRNIEGADVIDRLGMALTGRSPSSHDWQGNRVRQYRPIKAVNDRPGDAIERVIEAIKSRHSYDRDLDGAARKRRYIPIKKQSDPGVVFVKIVGAIEVWEERHRDLVDQGVQGGYTEEKPEAAKEGVINIHVVEKSQDKDKKEKRKKSRSGDRDGKKKKKDKKKNRSESSEGKKKKKKDKKKKSSASRSPSGEKKHKKDIKVSEVDKKRKDGRIDVDKSADKYNSSALNEENPGSTIKNKLKPELADHSTLKSQDNKPEITNINNSVETVDLKSHEHQNSSQVTNNRIDAEQSAGEYKQHSEFIDDNTSNLDDQYKPSSQQQFKVKSGIVIKTKKKPVTSTNLTNAKRHKDDPFSKQIVPSSTMDYEMKMRDRHIKLQEFLERRAVNQKHKIALNRKKEEDRINSQKSIWEGKRPMKVKGSHQEFDAEGDPAAHLMFDGKSCEQYYRDKYFEEVLGVNCPQEFMADHQYPTVVRPSYVIPKRTRRNINFSRHAIRKSQPPTTKIPVKTTIDEPTIMVYNQRSLVEDEGQETTMMKYRYYNQDKRGVKYISTTVRIKASAKQTHSGLGLEINAQQLPIPLGKSLKLPSIKKLAKSDF